MHPRPFITESLIPHIVPFTDFIRPGLILVRNLGGVLRIEITPNRKQESISAGIV